MSYHNPLFSLLSTTSFSRKIVYTIEGHTVVQKHLGPFKELKKVDSQAYKLIIPYHWRVSLVSTVAMLEPALGGSGPDPYELPVPE